MSTTPATAWKLVRTNQAGLGLRIVFSLAATLLIMGALQWLLWIGLLLANRWQREEYIAIGFLLGLAPWGVAMRRIWAGPRGRYRRVAQAAWGSAAVAAACTLASVLITNEVHRGEEFLVLGALMLGGGWIALLWTPIIADARPVGPMFDADGQVIVRCPTCGYSLVGLRALACPECGAQETIDALVRKQAPFWTAAPGRHPPGPHSAAPQAAGPHPAGPPAAGPQPAESQTAAPGPAGRPRQ